MSERQKYPSLIGDDIKESLLDHMFKQQTVSDESLYRAQRAITGDAARSLDTRLREGDSANLEAAQYELAQLSYVLSRAVAVHENVLIGASDERTRAQDDAIVFMHGAVYALEHVIFSRRDWLEREERRKRMEPYTQCLVQLIDELENFTAVELWALLYRRAFAIAKTTDDQEFIYEYEEDGYVRRMLLDLMQYLTTEERQMFSSKVRPHEASSAHGSAPIGHQT